MILILTRPTDFHSFFVQEALSRKGGKSILWHTSDFPQIQTWSVESRADGDLLWEPKGRELDWGGVPDVVWDRRPGPPMILSSVHPADQKFAEGECWTFYKWLYLLLPRDAFWVNRPEAAREAGSKIAQQLAAQRVGLQVIPTLFSNDPVRIRAFVHRHGEVIYKPFTQSGLWMLPGKGAAALFTACITPECISSDEVLQATPGIFQPLVRKQFELRVTVIGEHVFPAKIRSQEMNRGKLDWRVDPRELQIEPTEIPQRLESAIRKLMRGLGLVFGCLDFIVTPEGETVFLEVNEMGQFLFVEALTDIPLLDAFCELLLQGRTDFTWEPSQATTRMKDLDDLIVAQVAEAEKIHISPPDFFSVEQPAGQPEAEASLSSS